MSTDKQNNAPVSTEPVNWPAVEARISEFVNEYEMVGEDELGRDGCYTPSESERALILDAMHGALADDELMALLRPAAPVTAQAQPAFNVLAHLQRQRQWSERTFGPGLRTAGVCDHIRKELREIEADPIDLREWVDVVILALDGAWRTGATPQQIIDAIVAKQVKNEGRVWPDWRTVDPNKAIEHDRSGEALAQQPVSGADGFDAWIKREYPWLGPIGNGVVIAKEAWSAALAQQDADKVDAAPPSAHDREMFAIGRAIERGAESLPEGWAIQITIEAGAGTVHLIYPDTSGVLIHSGEPLSEQINEAYDAARKEQV